MTHFDYDIQESRFGQHVDRYRLALAFLVLVGFLLRVWNVGTAPLWIDEAFTTWAAKNVVLGNGFSDAIGPSSPYRRGWLTTTLPISAMFTVLGFTEFAARLPSVLIGTLTIVVVYLLGSQFSRQVGLLAAMVAALDPFMIVWAREARMYAHLQFLYLSAIYLLYRWGVDHDLRFKSRYAVALPVVVLLGLGTHRAFLAFGAVFLVYVAAKLVQNRQDVRILSVPDWAWRFVTVRRGLAVTGVIAVVVGYLAIESVSSASTTQAPVQSLARSGLSYWLIASGLLISVRSLIGLADHQLSEGRFQLRSLLERSRTVGSDVVFFRAALFLGGGLTLAGGYLYLNGIPSVLLAQSPEQWPTRGYLYYWEFFSETYPILWVLGVAGLVYLLLGDEKSKLVAYGFIIPFLVASVTSLKAPRYVYYILPLFICVAVVPAIAFTRVFLENVKQQFGHMSRSETDRLAITLVFVFALIVTPPAASLAVTENVDNPRFHPPRSDFDKASVFVENHRDASDLIMSTRPELSMWYLNDTDYFFRQRGLSNVESMNGRDVHTRTGTEVITNQSVLRTVMAKDRPIWLFAGKKFRQGFTAPEMRRFVEDRFIKIENDSWHNMVLYYWSPYLHKLSFGSVDDMGSTTGNAFVAHIQGKDYLALGRTVETESRFGTQGDGVRGQSIIRVPIRPNHPMIVQTRTYGSGEGARYVTVSVSTAGKNWRVVTENTEDGWATNRVIIPAEFAESDELYVRIEGGTQGQNRLGGLVDYVRIYSVQDWEREYVLSEGAQNESSGS